MYKLVESAKANGLEPKRYMSMLYEQLALVGCVVNKVANFFTVKVPVPVGKTQTHFYIHIT